HCPPPRRGSVCGAGGWDPDTSGRANSKSRWHRQEIAENLQRIEVAPPKNLGRANWRGAMGPAAFFWPDAPFGPETFPGGSTPVGPNRRQPGGCVAIEMWQRTYDTVIQYRH